MEGKGLIFIVSYILLCRVVNSDITCQVEGNDFCKFRLSGNVTGLVDFSSVFYRGPLETKSSGNDYLYDACSGVQCAGGQCGSDTCAACQKADENYGLGDIKTVTCDASQSDPSKKEWTIKLSYTGGQEGRESDFTFLYKPSESSPEMIFDQEKPGLDYHLSVQAHFTVPGMPPISCDPSPESPCKCTLGNGTTGTIDLSPLFSSGPLTTMSNESIYTYDACVGVSCEKSCGTNKTCAACESSTTADDGLGTLDSVKFNVSRSDISRGIWIIEVTYTGGRMNRQSSVVFEYVPNGEPKFEFHSENPALHYNMAVYGGFIVPGGSGPGLECVKDPTSPCKCSLNDGSGSVDLSPLFSKGPLNVTSGSHTYMYDACNGVACQEQCQPTWEKCAACQDKVGENIGHGLGSVSTVLFDVSRSDPSQGSWFVSLSYKDGSSGREFNVLVTLIPSTLKVDFQFLQENPPLHYHMALYGSFNVPKKILV